ncbi:MAG TPA: hypothetical protein VIF15_10090 [Polyangiaceae bacterium]
MPDPALALRRDALARRVFSLSGVVPLGVFLVVHVVVNARALRGAEAFTGAADAFARIPGLALVEAVFVFAPLLFHAAFGLYLVAARRPLVTPSPYPRALGIAVRATGVAALAFLAMHLPELRFHLPGARPAGGELLTLLAADLSSTSRGVPWRGVLYLLGSACVTFHFAAGVWGFFAGTRRGEEARARRFAGWAAGALGATMWLLFADVVVFHATGARTFGAAPDAPGLAEPCPPPPSSAAP